MKLNRIFMLAFVGALALHGGAQALDSNATPDACESYIKASAADVDSFNSNPGSLLSANALGGAQLTSTVKSLVLADPTLVSKFLDLLKTATPQQVSAIGSGLGQAVKAFKKSCGDADRKTAESVAVLVGTAGSDPLLTAFNSGLSGTATFAVNAPGATGPVIGGSVGGAVNGSVNQSPSTTNAPSPTNVSTANTTELITFSGVNATCTTSVSPTHSC